MQVPWHLFLSLGLTYVLVQPITGGAITGFLNATVEAGLAYPSLIQNSSVEVPEIILYGTTYDKVPYLIQLSGIGKPTDQVATVVCLAHCGPKIGIRYRGRGS